MIFTLAMLGVAFFAFAPMFVGGSFGVSQPASVFFLESSKPENLKLAFADEPKSQRKLRILVVPGHDDEYSGAEFQGIREADMTLSLGKQLALLLGTDDAFDVILARDDSGYNPLLSSYFSEQASKISLFVQAKKQIMTNLVSLGEVSKTDNNIAHVKVPSPVSLRLYGINKWANENNIDLVVHIHFNDYPRRRRAIPGEYSGFSIYAPEKQYSNARASFAVADKVSKKLNNFYSESNLPKEGDGVIEDQDLIAIGAFNTLDPASILIEYGYIYEPQFLDEDIRAKVIEDLAFQTYVGIHNFFGNSSPNSSGKFGTALLPYKWKTMPTNGAKADLSVLSLQSALTLEGFYPPKDFDSHDCPLSGTFGRCTRLALSLFQQKYGLSSGDSASVSLATLAKLNELYGQ